MQESIFIVCLREPQTVTDHREDPYWEAGSFGCTGCHSSNLMNPDAQHVPDGARFAFSQGGPLGARLVFVTPPVKIKNRNGTLVATWQPKMPLCYGKAPLLIDGNGGTDFPRFKKFIWKSKSKTWGHRLSSKCRSRAQKLSFSVGDELCRIFDAKYSSAANCDFALTYLDAIPNWAKWEEWSKTRYPWKPEDRKQPTLRFFDAELDARKDKALASLRIMSYCDGR
jgi:hypothetical protein